MIHVCDFDGHCWALLRCPHNAVASLGKGHWGLKLKLFDLLEASDHTVKQKCLHEISSFLLILSFRKKTYEILTKHFYKIVHLTPPSLTVSVNPWFQNTNDATEVFHIGSKLYLRHQRWGNSFASRPFCISSTENAWFRKGFGHAFKKSKYLISHRGWYPKFATGLNNIIRHSSKSIWLTNLLFCQNDSPIRRSFWQKDSLITHILFELCLLWYLAQSQILMISL